MAARHAGQKFMTNTQKLSTGVWPWTSGPRARLPYHYKLRYIEKFMVEPKPVHWRPDTRTHTVDKYGTRYPVQNVPIPVIFPQQADEGLWGGEGVIKGFWKKDNKKVKPRGATWKVPTIHNRVFYSEILDRWMAIQCTLRTLDLVDEAQGFDFYILQTHEVDLRSRLAMRIKQEMIESLSKATIYPDNPGKQSEILEKYQEFVLSPEESEWIGLTLVEAETKLLLAEEEERVNSIAPLKNLYLKDMVTRLEAGERDLYRDAMMAENKPKSTVSKLMSPFTRK